MTTMFYKLAGHDPVQCASGRIWADWYETAGESRVVARDEFDGFVISTIFTGIDPSIEPSKEPPLLFETMTFRDGVAEDIIRYATWSAAEAGHRAAVKWARNAARPDTAA
jgi:hypothetical protein